MQTHDPTGQNFQCCQISLLVAKLSTFMSLWQLFLELATLKFRYFLGYFQNFAKKQVYTGFNHDFFSFDAYIFDFSEAFDVGLLRFQNCFDVDLLDFSKIWFLLLKTFWQQCILKILLHSCTCTHLNPLSRIYPISAMHSLLVMIMVQYM